MTGFIPSIDPSNIGNLAGTVKFILTKFLQGVNDMIPATVISYDRASNRARVQPLLAVVTTANTQLQRPQVASIPVLQLGGGGFVISFPIKTGDLGWIKANDGDISLFLKTLQTASPNTARLHSFEDAMFIPDTMMRQVVINSEDAENVVLQTLDGTVRVAIWPDRVKVTAPLVDISCQNATVEAATAAHVTSPAITMTASTQITLDSPLTTITGALAAGTNSGDSATFSWPISTTQTVTASGEVTGSGKVLGTHVHTGVQTGGGNTGPPA